jgi:transcriptional regulator with XRE-family HTH domain
MRGGGIKEVKTVTEADQVERKTIREWRTARFLTQGELGDLIGVSYFTISNWELGVKQPRVKNLRALAKALGIRPEQIIPVEGKELPGTAA